MDKVLIVFLSATGAARIKALLEKKYAIPSKVLQTPSKLSETGCSYSLELSERHLQIAWNLVKNSGLTSKGVYRKGSLVKIL